MALKDFCISLKQCAEKLEEEIKFNINDCHNKFFAKTMDETKLALERAKDYHYKELVEAAREILINIKKIIFHQDKIEWLSNETNFSSEDLKRFSYVKRQVYAFSNGTQPSYARSAEDLSLTHKIRREKRRTVSEVSVGTLEAWEQYLDQKEKDEKPISEEVTKPVSRRKLSNARVRKKFVSSTLGGFLEEDGQMSILESIGECSQDIESDDENKKNKSPLSKSCENLKNKFQNNLSTKSMDHLNATFSLVDRINNISSSEEQINQEILRSFEDDFGQSDFKAVADHVKPKIVDVIYKKKPS